MLIRIGYDVALRLYHPDVPITMVFGTHRLEKFSVVTEGVKLDDILNPLTREERSVSRKRRWKPSKQPADRHVPLSVCFAPPANRSLDRGSTD
jgi:hypothetical protein